MPSIRIVFSFILVLTISRAFSQKTAINREPEEWFHQGISLYDQQMYGSAGVAFENFIRLAPNSSMTADASIYLCMTQLNLMHANAADELKEILNEYPENSLNNLANFELGNFYFEKRKYKQAIKHFEKVSVAALSKDKWQEAGFKIAYSNFQSGKLKEAKPWFDKTRNQQGKHYVASNYYYGYICYTEKNYSAAIKSFEKIKNEGPKVMDLYMAQMYFAQEDYPKSLEYLKKVQDAKYKDEVQLLKGKVHFQTGNFKEAYTAFSTWGGNLDDLSHEENYQFAFSYQESKQYEKAASFYVKISAEETELGQLSAYNLAGCFLKLNKKQNAYNAFGSAKRLDFNKNLKEVSHYNYARLAFELGYQSIAIKSVQDFIQEYPNSEFNDAAKGVLAEMFLQTNNYSQAVQVLDGIKNLNEQTKKVYQKITFRRGEEMFNNHEFAESKAMFSKSLKYVYDKKLEAEAYFWLGESEYKNKSYASAINQFNRFINSTESKKSKLYNVAFYNMGYAYFMQNNYGQAVNYFRKYKEQESYFGKAPERFVDNSMRLADCYFLLSQYPQAAEAYGYVVSKQFEGADYAMFQQGILFGLMKRNDEKINLLQRLGNQYPKSIYADDAYFEAGNALFEQGENAKAETAYNILISKFDDSPFLPVAYNRLALIYYGRNMDDKALSYCKTVVDRYPRTESAMDAMRLAEMIYVNSGRGEEYLDWAKSVPNADIRITYQDSLLFESAMTRYREGDCEKAVKGFNSYIERFGQKGFFLTDASYYAAECELKRKNNKEAIKHYKQVVELPANERTEASCLRLARLFYAEKNYGEAQTYYEKLEKTATGESNYLEGLVGQMRCNYALERYDAAKKNAVALLPMKNVPKDYLIEANMTLGRIQLKDNNLITARFHFNYVANESRAVIGAEALYQIAKIEYLEQKFDSCRERIFDLNDRFSSHEYWVISGFILLSDVYVSQNDYFQARATLQTILDSYTGNQSLMDECKLKLKKVEEMEEAEKNRKKTKPNQLVPEEGD